MPMTELSARLEKVDPLRFDTPAKSLLIAITIMQAAFALLCASHKPLWFDEINTLAVSQLRSWSAIWQADLNHVDGMPPLYHYLEGLFLRLPLRPEIALRIPSILGFSLLIPSLFMFANRSVGERCASAAACFPLVTSSYSYSYEARCYALTLGLTAAALLFWQKAQGKPQSVAWPIALGLALAAVSATNYYGMYGFIPFFIAEGVSVLLYRRIKWRVWAALMFAFIPYGLYWPILKGLRQYYSAGFFAKPSFRHLAGSAIFSWADQSTAVFFLLLITTGVVVIFWSPKARFFRKGGSLPGVRAEEWAICFGFCALPAFVFLISSVLKGGMVPRYSICIVIGVSLLVAYAMPSFKPVASNMVVACATVAFAMIGMWHLGSSTNPQKQIWEYHSLLRQYLDGKTPIVVSDGLGYLQLAYYSSPEAQRQLYYIAGPVQAVRYLHADSVDLNLVVLAKYLPLQVTSYTEFISQHEDFYVYTDSHWDWLDPYLLENGRSARFVLKDHDWTLYDVKQAMPQQPGH